MANVLCRVEDGEIRCVGFLDLEAALAGPPEADLAKIGIYHGPLFGKPLNGCWFERVWEGYGKPLDPIVLAFFRAFHLVNIGFHSAFTGNKAHAGEIARAAQEEVDALTR
jgi:aminoglycoside phosphotransferase (APT) family kinase protein